MNISGFYLLAALVCGIATLVFGFLGNYQTRREDKAEIVSLKSVITEQKNANVDLAKKQVEIYKDSLTQWRDGKILMPPNFLQEQEKALALSTKNIEDWAKSLGSLKGKEKERLELEHAALSIRAELLNAKAISALEPLKTGVKRLVDELNKSKVLGEQIIYIENKSKLIFYPSNDFDSGGQGQEWLRVTLPSSELNFNISSIAVKPSTDNYENFNIYVEVKDIRIGITPKGEYFFDRHGSWDETSPRMDWKWKNEFIAKKPGESDLFEFLKLLFQEEVKLA